MKQQVPQQQSKGPSRAPVRTGTRPGASGVAIPNAFPLHRSLGNQKFQQLFHSGAIQAKLQISQPCDPAELEADRVADRVMRMPDSIRAGWLRLAALRLCVKRLG